MEGDGCHFQFLYKGHFNCGLKVETSCTQHVLVQTRTDELVDPCFQYIIGRTSRE